MNPTLLSARLRGLSTPQRFITSTPVCSVRGTGWRATARLLTVWLALLLGWSSLASAQAIDPTFNPTDVGFGNGDGFNSIVQSVAVQADGKILIGGIFTTYNGTGRNRIARIEAAAAPPTITGFAAIPGTVCAGSVATFTATVGNVTGTYNFTLTNGTTTVEGTSPSAAFSQTVVANQGEELSYTLTVAQNGESASATTGLELFALPELSLTASDDISCSVRVVTLTAEGEGIVSYEFGPGVSDVNGNTGTVDQTGVYSVTATDFNGCSSTASVTVNESTTPDLLTWTGETSTDWNTASNWCPARVPLAIDNVEIPSEPVNQPVLSTTAVSGGLLVESGASLTITSAGGLTINGGSGFVVFVNQGSVVNSGLLVLGSAVNVGLSNRGSFSNLSGGRIQIDNSIQIGLENQTGSSFINSASIVIGATAPAGAAGLDVDNGSSFSNLSGGLIQIDRTTGAGLINRPNSIFVNSARIIIGATASVGLYGLANLSSFSNLTGGSIQINRTTNTALYNLGGASFVNSASIVIGAGISSTAVTNEGTGTTFNNEGCGALLLVAADAAILNDPFSTATFTNTGLIIENASGDSNISENQGVVANNNGGAFDTGNGPNQSLSVSVTNPTRCDTPNGSITISGLKANTTYALSYTVGSSTGSRTANSGGSGQFVVNGLAGGTYSLVLSSSCLAQSLPLSATLNAPPRPAPITYRLTNSGTVCAGTPLVVTAEGCNSGTVSFTINPATPSGTVAQSTYTFLANTPPGTYTVCAICTDNTTGCSSPMALTTVTIAPLPVATLSASGSGTLTCGQPSLTLTAGGGSSYAFAGPGIVSQNMTSGTAVVNASGVYSVTVSTASGCSSTTSVEVFSNTTAPANASLSASNSAGVASNTLTCAVTSLTLTASTTSSGSFTYSFAGPGLAQSGSSPTAVVSTPGTYSVTITNASGCTALASTTVQSNTVSPVTSLSASGPLNCGVSSVTLTANGGNTYAFGPGVSNVSGNTGTVSAAGVYSVTVTDAASGCSDVASVTVSCAAVGSTTRYVSTTGTNTNPNTATSWATSTTSLQGAINSLTTIGGGTVYVAQGLYKPGGNTNTNRTISFSMANNVTIIGGYVGDGAPGSATPLSSTLSGDIGVAGSLTDNSYHVIFNPASASLNATAVIDGFVIADGNADVGGAANLNQLGGGMLNNGTGSGGVCSPIIRNCLFQNNVARNGGALYNNGSVGGNSSPTLTNTSFQSNTAYILNPSGVGGAVYNNGSGGTSSPSFVNCSFQNNRANRGNGTFGTAGGAIHNEGLNGGTSSPSFVNCSFLNNAATGAGAGGAVNNNSSAGGSSSPSFVNCSFQGNAATVGANFGGYAISSFVNNSTALPTLVNCVVFGNGGSNTFRGSVSATYSLFDNAVTNYTTGGVGNLTTTTSPFASTATTQLSGCAPAINAGDPASQTAASGPYSVAALPPTDLAGNARIFGARVDMGAYEFQADPNARVAITAAPATSSAVCAGSAVSVPVSVSGTGPYTYQWYKNSINSPVLSQTTATLSLTSVATTDAGSYSVVITGACNSVTSTAFALSVNNPPANVSLTAGTSAGVASNTLTCAVTSLTLRASTSNTGSFTYAFVGPGLAQSGSSATATASGPGVYSVTITNASSCTAAATTTVVSNTANPVASLVSSGTLTCASPSVTLTAGGGNTGETFSYTFSSGASRLGSTNQAVVSTGGVYSVTVANANGCTRVATTEVFSNTATPTATLVSSNDLSCSVTSATLTASGGQVYAFSAGASQIGGSTGNTATVSTGGSYSVTVTSANGCTTVVTTRVVSDTATPTATLISNGPLTCAQTSVTLMATGGGTYAFAGPGLTSSDPVAGTAVVNASGTYTVLVTSTNGCSASATTSVTSDTAATMVSLVSSNSLNCSVTSATLTANISTRAGTYTYAFSAGASQIGTSNQAIVTAGGPYSVTVTSDNGCLVMGATSVVSDTMAPVATLMSSNDLSCSVTSTTLTGGGGQTYNFSGPGFAQNGPASTAVVSQPGTYTLVVTGTNGCSAVVTSAVNQSTTVATPDFATRGNQDIPDGLTSVTVLQNSAPVTFQATNCSGTLTWSGHGQMGTTTLNASTSATGVFVYQAVCMVGSCLSSPASVTLTVNPLPVVTRLTVLQRDPDNGQLGTNTLKPYLQLRNDGTAPIPYSEITVRYWLTVENPAPLVAQIGSQLGNGNVRFSAFPVRPVRQGADTYLEFSFTAGAGSLAGGANSGDIQVSVRKEDYSGFNQGDDYSYVLNRDFAPNARITAYRNGPNGAPVLIYGTEPGGMVNAPLTVTLTASPTTILTTGTTTLSATAAGGSAPYTYSFSGPGTISASGNTATVSNLSATVHTFTVMVTDLSAPTNQTISASVSVTVNTPAPVNQPPVATANSNQTATVGVRFSYTVNAFTDETPQSLTYAASINPANGLSFDAATRTITGTPTATGVSSVTVTATDAGGLSASTVFSITVNPAPVTALTLVASANPTTILTTGTTTLSATVSGGTPGYSYSFAGPGTIQASGNTATASNLPAGVQTFTVVASDATSPNSQTISGTVSVTVNTPAPVNQPPVATANSNQTATVGTLFSYTVNAFTDETPQSLTYAASINPANGFGFDGATRTITGTPTATGVSSVTVTATDAGGLSASTVFSITVNPAPVVATPLALTVTASPTTILTTGTTTLSATVSGGTPGYTYSFAGPGTISASGNTATVSNLPAGVQTFTVVASDATSPNSQTISGTVSVTVNTPAPVNQPPVATANSNQTATVGVRFSYQVNAFTDETPNSLTYTASINPANGLSFNAATRVVSGTPTATGVSSVTVTATDAGGLSASTVFSITVNPAPVVATRLTVLQRDPDNGQLNTNTLKPYLQLRNDGTAPIPYSEITVRYWLTVENPAPLVAQIGSQLGNGNVRFSAFPVRPVRQGADTYLEFSFTAGAGSLAGGANSGDIQVSVRKEDYSGFNQGDDYSYVLNRDFAPNARITAYRNGQLIYGVEPAMGTRLAAEATNVPLSVRVLGNPVRGNEVLVDVQGAIGEPLLLRVRNLKGHLLSERAVESRSVEPLRVSLGQGTAGMLLLEVSTPTQRQTVKVLRVE